MKKNEHNRRRGRTRVLMRPDRKTPSRLTQAMGQDDPARDGLSSERFVPGGAGRKVRKPRYEFDEANGSEVHRAAFSAAVAAWSPDPAGVDPGARRNSPG